MNLKNILISTVFAMSGTLGLVAGWNWSTPQVSAAAAIPTETPTQINTAMPVIITATASPALAFVEIVPDTPMPAIQNVYVVDAAPVDLQTQETIIEPTADYSQWITPLNTAPITDIPLSTFASPAPSIIPLSPMSLDDAWDTVIALGMDDRFASCVFPLSAPFITWDMALEASELQASGRTYTEIKMDASEIARIVSRGGLFFPPDGIIQVDEDLVPSLLTPLYYNGSISVCRDANNKPNLYGAGIQEFLNLLAASYAHE
jgi:hypothetical protein